MNSKIENGYARVIDSRVAESLGVTEAFILQQIRYWIEKSNNFVNDKYWTYHTYHEWHEQLPFFSEMTIRRAIKHLEKTGIVLSGRFNKMGGDKTKWYSVDEDKLNEWLSHLTYKANAFAVNDMLTVHNEQTTVQDEQTTVQDEQDGLPLSVQDEQSNTNRIHIKDYNKEYQENQINCLTRTASHAHASNPYDFGISAGKLIMPMQRWMTVCHSILTALKCWNSISITTKPSRARCIRKWSRKP